MTQVRHPGQPILKSSSLATLFALEDDCRVVSGGLEGVSGLRRKARVMRVRTSEGGDNLCFVDREHGNEAARDDDEGSLRGSTKQGEGEVSPRASTRGRDDDAASGIHDVEKKGFVAASNSSVRDKE